MKVTVIAAAAACLLLSTPAFAETWQEEYARLQYEHECAQVNFVASAVSNVPGAGGFIGFVLGFDCSIRAIKYAQIALDEFRWKHHIPTGVVAYRAQAQANAGLVAEMRAKTMYRREQQARGDWRTNY